MSNRSSSVNTGVRTKPACVSATGCALACMASAHCFASFTHWTVETRGIIGGRSVYQLFANFSDPNVRLISCLNHRVQSGAMNALHNDYGGSWNPNFTVLPEHVSNDSFVTIAGFTGVNASTNLDPTFGNGVGSEIPEGAGWYNAVPGTPIIVGPSLRVMVMQIALSPHSSGYTGYLEVGYTIGADSTQPLFGGGTYGPAPGALVLLSSMAALGTTRRRRSPG